MTSLDESERRRWLAKAASALVVLKLAGLSGCGGGGDETGDEPPAPPPPTPGAGSGVAEAQDAQAALSAITALAGLSPDFNASAAAAALAASGRFERTGVAGGTQAAWGRTRAGRWLLVVPHAGSATGATATPARAGRKRALRGGTELPRLLVARQMRVLDMLGAIQRIERPHLVREAIDAQTLQSLRLIAAARGFDLVPSTPDADFAFALQTTVEGMKSVRGDGVFVINSFGGSGEDGLSSVSAIATTTPAFVRSSSGQETTDPAYADDLANDRLVQMVIPDLRFDRGTYRAVLGITPEFGRFYGWQFEPNSLVWLNVSGGGIVGNWQSMLGARGAGTLVGFSAGPSLIDMLAVSEDFFNLTLASGRFDGPGAAGLRQRPRLRNYGNGESLQFLVERGLTSASELAYFPKASPAELVNLMSPTLDYLAIDEDQETGELIGQFGADRDGSVLLATQLNAFAEPLMADATDPTVQFGDPVPILEWKGDRVEVDLRNARRTGYLQLRNDGRWTNLVQLTRWQVPITIRASIDGQLLLDLTIRLHLRGDVRGYRLRPDQPLFEQQFEVPLQRMASTTAQWSASGAIERTEAGTTTRIEWSGSSEVSTTRAPDEVIGFSGMMQLNDRRFDAQLLVRATGLRERTRITRGGELISDSTVELPLQVAFPLDALEGLALRFDERWTLEPGSARGSETISVLGPRTREVQVIWPGSVPDFPPEDGVGGR